MPGSVLIVEDEHAIRNILSEILEECGFVVTVAAEMRSARALVRADPDEFDFIVLDTWLPDGDGVAFCAELRQARFDRPIIALSETYSSQARVAAAGASAWILKPFTLSTLLEQVEAALLRHCDACHGMVREPSLRAIPIC